SASAPRLRVLTEAQEALLVSDEKLLLVAVCAINYWTVQDIVSAYRLTQAECVKYLLMLDRMNVIALLPGDRIRVRVARDFDWLPGGPIRRYFHAHVLDDFLGSRFDGPGETMTFLQGMLTDAAAAVPVRARRRPRRSAFPAGTSSSRPGRRSGCRESRRARAHGSSGESGHPAASRNRARRARESGRRATARSRSSGRASADISRTRPA
ncbi:hypothetical protein QM334_40580, partial [Burkholderia cenocepacia]|nr:hypothetical protein [Burkholderia cenocepacia]